MDHLCVLTMHQVTVIHYTHQHRSCRCILWSQIAVLILAMDHVQKGQTVYTMLLLQSAASAYSSFLSGVVCLAQLMEAELHTLQVLNSGTSNVVKEREHTFVCLPLFRVVYRCMYNAHVLNLSVQNMYSYHLFVSLRLFVFVYMVTQLCISANMFVGVCVCVCLCVCFTNASTPLNAQFKCKYQPYALLPLEKYSTVPPLFPWMLLINGPVNTPS